tara:strand:+ start:186 stop:362 length:177 start_codon:yes stop_codon:yes gene_type:complete
MISSEMKRNSLFEAVVFNETMKVLKKDRMWKFEFFFMESVAKNFGFWFIMLGNDWEDL